MDSHSDPNNNNNRHGHSHQKHSSSELLSSAKLVANAAQSTFRHDSSSTTNNKVDKAQVANAAGDLLEAACHYGKLEDKPFGKYLDKAEDYLHNYGGSSHTSAAAAGAGNPHHPTGAGSHSAKPDHQSHGPDYMKMAQGFLGSSGSKPDSHSSKTDHSGSDGGYGDYFKLAQGFLKK